MITAFFTDGTQGNSPLRWFLIQRSVDRQYGHVRGGAKLRYTLETGDSDPRTETSRDRKSVV